jgi:hypothetical protein
VNNILCPIIAELTEERLQVPQSQQDYATPHTVRPLSEALREVFDGCRLNSGLWRPRSPDWIPLWLLLKWKFKRKRVQNKSLEELRIYNRSEISTISGEQPQRANVFHSFTECIRSGRQHFQHLYCTYDLLLDFLKVVITANLYPSTFTDC